MSNEAFIRQIKNKLASALVDGWLDFVEAIPLPKNLILIIEEEERDAEERAHRVLCYWYQSHPEEFTAANVKKKLKSIHRNDIIIDIFGSG